MCYSVAMILAIVNAKGGVTKTTTSMYIATALCSYGSTVVLDVDLQGSASEWANDVLDAGEQLPFAVQPANQRTLARAATSFTHTVIDTPPGNPQTMDAAIKAADIVLIPTQPSNMDIRQVWPMIDAAAAAGKPVAVLLSRVRQGTRARAAATQVLEDAGVALMDTQIILKEEIQNSFGTVPTELFGYDQVAKDLLEVHNSGN